MWFTSDRFSVRLEPHSTEWGKLTVRAHTRQCLVRFMGKSAVELYGIEERKRKGDLRYSMDLPRGEVLQAVRNVLDKMAPDALIKVDPWRGINLNDPDTVRRVFGDE